MRLGTLDAPTQTVGPFRSLTPAAALLVTMFSAADSAGRAVAVVSSASGQAAEVDRVALEDAARRAVDALPGVSAQGAKNTADHLAEASSMGITCDPIETGCAARLG